MKGSAGGGGGVSQNCYLEKKKIREKVDNFIKVKQMTTKVGQWD
jgi:hypothetical protein